MREKVAHLLFVLKINLFVKMYGFNGNKQRIKKWGCAYKITHASAATYPRLLNLVQN